MNGKERREARTGMGEKAVQVGREQYDEQAENQEITPRFFAQEPDARDNLDQAVRDEPDRDRYLPVPIGGDKKPRGKPNVSHARHDLVRSDRNAPGSNGHTIVFASASTSSAWSAGFTSS